MQKTQGPFDKNRIFWYLHIAASSSTPSSGFFSGSSALFFAVTCLFKNAENARTIRPKSSQASGWHAKTANMQFALHSPARIALRLSKPWFLNGCGWGQEATGRAPRGLQEASPLPRLQEAPTKPPRGPQEAPKRPPNGPQEAPKRPPRSPQGVPKRPPRGPRQAPKTPPGGQSINHSINQSIDQPPNQPTKQSINQYAINNHSTNQPINQSITQLTHQSFLQPLFHRPWPGRMRVSG